MPVNFIIENPTEDAWFTFHQTFYSLTKCEEDSFAEVGIPLQQYIVLAAIKGMKDPVTPTNLASWLDRNPNTVSSIINRMEEDGLVNRVRDLKDRRVLRLTVTAKGDRKLKDGLVPATEFPKKIMAVFSPKEISVLRKLLKKLRDKTYEIRNIKDSVVTIDSRK